MLASTSNAGAADHHQQQQQEQQAVTAQQQDQPQQPKVSPILLPLSQRLGRPLSSAESFTESLQPLLSKLQAAGTPLVPKQYTLVVCISLSQGRILLGRKNRGFGTGKFNSFGGKVEKGEDVLTCAVRELKEEANIDCPSCQMRAVGLLDFTFEDTVANMVVHVFAVDLDSADVNAGDVRGCEEITPQYFELDQIPYDNMFADDSSWLPLLLDGTTKLQKPFHGRYHYKEGGDSSNCIDFYFLDQGN
jgi:8-oxo-dGTP pyrophosphatase MutT (NUDIX family)